MPTVTLRLSPNEVAEAIREKYKLKSNAKVVFIISESRRLLRQYRRL
jgi:hypothetical protein